MATLKGLGSGFSSTGSARGGSRALVFCYPKACSRISHCAAGTLARKQMLGSTVSPGSLAGLPGGDGGVTRTWRLPSPFGAPSSRAGRSGAGWANPTGDFVGLDSKPCLLDTRRSGAQATAVCFWTGAAPRTRAAEVRSHTCSPFASRRVVVLVCCCVLLCCAGRVTPLHGVRARRRKAQHSCCTVFRLRCACVVPSSLVAATLRAIELLFGRMTFGARVDTEDPHHPLAAHIRTGCTPVPCI